MRKLITAICTLFFTVSLFAQQDVQYSQFIFNKMAYNPAYAGSKEAMTLGAIYRHQWQGIEGAPRTLSAFAHAPFLNNRCGAGLAITSDRIGMVDNSYIDLNYAYRIALQKETVLSVGLLTRFEYSRVDWTKAETVDFGDQLIPTETNQSGVNFGLGMYLSSKNYYVGLSVPSLLKTTLYNSSEFFGINEISKYRSYYLMGGIIARVADNVMFKPAMMISYSPNAPFELDMNASFLFMQAFWIGATYRLGDSVDAVLQYQLSKQFKLGLATDFTLSELRDYTSGSFEVMIEYLFFYDKEGINNIRFF